MCASCDRLRAELREVKEELAEWKRPPEITDADRMARLKAALPMERQTAILLIRLHQSPGLVVENGELIELIGYKGEDRDLPRGKSDRVNALKVIVTKARRALEHIAIYDSIKFAYGGYVMSREAAAAIRGLVA